MCLDALLFRKSMHKELQFCSFKHSMLDPLEKPKHSAPNLYASDIAPCQTVSMGMEYGSFITMVRVNYSFKLYTTCHVFGHFGFHWWCPCIQSSKQCTTHTYIYVYIYIYACKGQHEYPWNSPHSMRWKLAHPWWGSNPRSLDYIPSSITRHVSDHQSKASQIYFDISGSPNIETVYENDRYVK